MSLPWRSHPGSLIPLVACSACTLLVGFGLGLCLPAPSGRALQIPAPAPAAAPAAEAAAESPHAPADPTAFGASAELATPEPSVAEPPSPAFPDLDAVPQPETPGGEAP